MRISKGFLRGILFGAFLAFAFHHAFSVLSAEIAALFILPFWFMFAAIVYWWETRSNKWRRKRSGRDRRKGVDI